MERKSWKFSKIDSFSNILIYFSTLLQLPPDLLQWGVISFEWAGFSMRKCPHYVTVQRRRQDFGSWGNILGGRLRRGSAGLSPPDAREIMKICKKFIKKIAKIDYFSAIFQKKIENPALNFRAFGRKTQLFGNFLKKFQKFLEKIAKMHYFRLFSTKFQKPRVNFSRVWTKNTNCWEILRKLWKIVIKIQ